MNSKVCSRTEGRVGARGGVGGLAGDTNKRLIF